MVTVLYDVAQQGRSRINIIDDHVHMPIVEQVAHGGAASCEQGGQPAAGSRRDLLKFFTVKIAKKLRALSPRGAPILLVNAWIDMTVSHEEVGESVVIKIQRDNSPAKKRDSRFTESRGECFIREIPVAVIDIESVVIV